MGTWMTCTNMIVAQESWSGPGQCNPPHLPHCTWSCRRVEEAWHRVPINSAAEPTGNTHLRQRMIDNESSGGQSSRSKEEGEEEEGDLGMDRCFME
ncbi:hypothetical protein CRG98_044646 [Punica granatum]|uniref:Uncharacterized protein n=1 Tax=Punica granatum TaxID=22663 RepID=A0A2I0HTZ5_PUNGR|nr:hypothetical protein CRG98_044646 [Punica granatum]